MALPCVIVIIKLRVLLSFSIISSGYQGMITNGYHVM